LSREQSDNTLQHHSPAVVDAVHAQDADVAAATQQSTCESDNAQVSCENSNDIASSTHVNAHMRHCRCQWWWHSPVSQPIWNFYGSQSTDDVLTSIGRTGSIRSPHSRRHMWIQCESIMPA